MATASLNGVHLYYETTGSGEPLVLTHGSWTDASGWSPAIAALGSLGALDGRYRVVAWDRRGHSRSGGGDRPGSRAEDANDLAALIEHLGGGPVHLAGNSYGSIVVLTLVASRPDLVASATVHEPPVLTLQESAASRTAQATTERDLRAVLELIEAGEHRAAAEEFVERVAFGPGTWVQLPEAFRATLVANAPTFLDEERDPTSRSVDLDALTTTSVPILLTHGTASPPWFGPIVTDLPRLIPTARTSVIDGAGHAPHTTHPQAWAATLLAFHDSVRNGRRESRD